MQKSRPAAHSHKKIYSADTFVGGSIRLLKIAEHRVGVQNTGPARRITAARVSRKEIVRGKPHSLAVFSQNIYNNKKCAAAGRAEK